MFAKTNVVLSIQTSNIIILPFPLISHPIISASREGLNMITVLLLCLEP